MQLAQANGLVAIVLFGVAILISTGLLRRDPLAKVPVGARVVTWLSLLPAIILGVLLGAFSLVLAIAAGAALYIAYRRRNEAQRAFNLSLLRTAVSRNMPVVTLLHGAGREVAYPAGYWVQRLAADLEAGMPLDEAVARHQRCFPSGTASVVSIGLQTGRLREAIDEYCKQLLQQHNYGQRIKAQLSYVFLLGIAVAGLTTYVVSRGIAHVFSGFYADGRFQESWPMRLFESAWLQQGLFATVFALLAVLLLVHFAGSRLAMLPILGRPLRWFYGAGVLRQLATVTESNLPFSLALNSLGERFPVGALRRRIRKAAIGVSGGANWIECLQRQGILGVDEVPVLNVAQRVGNLPWTLRLLADRRERVTATRLSLANSMLLPLLMLPLVTLVLLVAAAIFTSMSELIISEAALR